MGDMVERVARALMEAPTRNGKLGDFIHGDEATSAAQAVLAAMLIPTDEMTAAGAYEIWHETYADHADPEPGEHDRRIALNLWTVMIEKSGGAA